MPLAGKTLMPRVIADACFRLTPWRNYELTKAIGTALGESAGSLGAWHDNLNDAGQLSSRDCGLFQINIPESKVGTAFEDSLRTDSMDESVYTPVEENNIAAALELCQEPWRRDGKQDIRRWEAWVAYTSGWVLFPEWWVWTEAEPHQWAPTGRYIQRAIAGQMNMHVVIHHDWTTEQALYYGKRYCGRFGIDPDLLYIDGKAGILKWHVPPEPTSPPSDGVGIRPQPNDGV